MPENLHLRRYKATLAALKNSRNNTIITSIRLQNATLSSVIQ